MAAVEAKVELDPRAARAPHLITTAPPVEYEVVVPTYRRWLSTQEVTRKKRFQTSSRPFILEHTLAFLSREGVPKQKVTLFVANEEEEQEYRKAIQESEWAEVRIQVSLPGIRDSRNFIYKFFPAGTYVVSLDDDMEGIQWKIREGSKISACMELLPPGAFIKIIYDAYQRMQDVGGYLWGLSTCQNPHFISLDDVSTRNGLVNGYLHGFICRPDAAHDLLRRLPDAVEDAEFSVRHFAKDRVVLRYRMYAGMTSPYSNGGGLQSKFNARAGDVRKTEEWYGAQQLHQLFPTLIAAPSNGDSQRYHATEVRFISQTGDGIKSRRAAVRRFQGLCRFVLPQLKGNKKKSDRGKSALAKVKAFAMKKPMQPAQSSSKRMLHGKSGEVAKVEGPLALLPEDQLRFVANPKQRGTEAHRRYAKYSRAKKVKDLAGLGCKPVDRLFDLKAGYLKVVDLDTRPVSSECVVEEVEVPKVSVGKGRPVPVRLAEATGKHAGLHLSREALAPLQQRCPALQGSWAKFAAKLGPLSEVSLPCFRILLHWAKTSRLVFSHQRAQEVLKALQSLGADAKRLSEWMAKQQLKFNAFEPTTPVEASGSILAKQEEPAGCPGKRSRGKPVKKSAKPAVGKGQAPCAKLQKRRLAQCTVKDTCKPLPFFRKKHSSANTQDEPSAEMQAETQPASSNLPVDKQHADWQHEPAETRTQPMQPVAATVQSAMAEKKQAELQSTAQTPEETQQAQLADTLAAEAQSEGQSAERQPAEAQAMKPPAETQQAQLADTLAAEAQSEAQSAERQPAEAQAMKPPAEIQQAQLADTLAAEAQSEGSTMAAGEQAAERQPADRQPVQKQAAQSPPSTPDRSVGQVIPALDTPPAPQTPAGKLDAADCKPKAGDDVTIVLGNERHRQKNLRSMFTRRTGG
ncbi:unnamed protein product [Effrenium voratum]|nr:unnamed protein product [Effrenium voratum]